MRPTLSKLSIMIMLLGPFFVGCTGGPGGNPAAPPAPLAEVPLFLRIPTAEQISINVDKVSSSEAISSASLMIMSAHPKFLIGSGEFSDEIATTSDGIQLIQKALTKFLDPLHQLLIPAGEDIHNFEGLAIIMQGEAPGSKGDFVEFRIDFSDFDYDGNGSSEGCSGNSAELPICMRIWANSRLTPFIGQREGAAVFTSFPTVDNAGAGRLKIINLDHTIGFPFFDGAGVGIIYNHQDPEDRVTELFVNATPEEFDFLKTSLTGAKSETVTEDTTFKLHALVTQLGPEETAIKMINLNFSVTDFDGIDFQSTESVSRWTEDGDYWSAILHPFNRPDLTPLENQCVQISTAAGVDRSFCLDLGVDVENIEIVGPVKPEDASLPADFPESPTFSSGPRPPAPATPANVSFFGSGCSLVNRDSHL